MTSFDLTLYLVTDRRMPKEGFETVVEEAIRGGVTLVQLRERKGIRVCSTNGRAG